MTKLLPLALFWLASGLAAPAVVVPFTAGSSPDVVIRLMAPRLSEQLGQQFIIENRTGAAGIVGAGAVA